MGRGASDDLTLGSPPGPRCGVLTGFLLAAGAERADADLERTGWTTLSTPSFERFVAALDDRPEPMPVLARCANEPAPPPPQ